MQTEIAKNFNTFVNFFHGVIEPTLMHPAINIVALLIGWLVGNRMAIGRDKRKEFNIIVEPIRNKFLNFKGQPIPIAEHDIIDIRNGLCSWRKIGFRIAIKRYKKAISQENMKSDGMGGFHIIHQKLIIDSSTKLLKYLKKK